MSNHDLEATDTATGATLTFPFCGLDQDWSERAWTLDETYTLFDDERGGFEILAEYGDGRVTLAAQCDCITDALSFYFSLVPTIPSGG